MYNKYNYDCKEIQDLYLMCMKLPPKKNKCIIPFNIFIKCINDINIKI